MKLLAIVKLTSLVHRIFRLLTQATTSAHWEKKFDSAWQWVMKKAASDGFEIDGKKLKLTPC